MDRKFGFKRLLVVLTLSLSSCGESPDTITSPDIEPDTVVETPINEEDAARILNLVTFGATQKSIDDLVELELSHWLDAQLAMDASLHSPLIEPFKTRDDFWRRYRMAAWFHQAIYAEDQLRQRVAFALSELLVVSEFNASLADDPLAVANYYDLLLQHAFGNYRELLEAVTRSPAMGVYLSMLGNEKPDESRNIRPDENYAREVMQLFTIGLVELNLDGSQKMDEQGEPIATYDQTIIKGFAHVFTGWHFNGTTEGTWYNWWHNRDLYSPMVAVDAFHDQQEKQLFNGVLLPAQQAAQQDLTQALDALFNHDNVPPFIAKQLIQKLITSNPPSDYVERIAQVFIDDGTGVRGNLAAVVRAIILDEYVLTGPKTDVGTFGKVREPILTATHMWRAFYFSTENEIVDLGWPEYFFNQAPLASPSVFNFFRPDYSPPSLKNEHGLLAPELQIATETGVTHRSNFVAWYGMWRSFSGEFYDVEEEDRQSLWLDLTTYVSLAESDPLALMQQLNLILTANALSDEAIDLLVADYEAQTWAKTHERIANAIFLIMASPQYMVIR